MAGAAGEQRAGGSGEVARGGVGQPSPSTQHRPRPPRRPLDQNNVRAPHFRRRTPCQSRPIRLDRLRQAGRLDGRGHVVGQGAGGGGAGAGGVGKEKGGFIGVRPQQMQCLLMLGLGLAAKADQDVGGQGDAGQGRPHAGREGVVGGPRVAAPHAAQHRVRPRLGGHVHLLAYVWVGRHHVQHGVVKVLGVGGREANADVRVDRSHGGQQVGKPGRAGSGGRVDGRKAGRIRGSRRGGRGGPGGGQCGPAGALGRARPVGVRIHVLPEQRDLAHAGASQPLDLLHHAGQGPGPLPAAHGGHDAKGAHVVAAAHDRDVRADGPRPRHGHDVGVRLGG